MARTRLALNSVSVVEALAASIRERVLSGEFPPGSQLRDVELANEYGVSRPTVRAGLQRLTMTGLVVREANRSAVVPRLEPGDVIDLYSARGIIETETLRRVSRDRGDTSAADRVVRRLEKFGDDARWSVIVEADLDFHRSLAQAAGSPRLLRLFEMLEDEIRLSIAQLRPAYESPASLAREHRGLLDAVESGNADRAAALVRQHLDQAVRDIIGAEPAEEA
jgi:DNA-binding GntR family transcriptional regulator